jgi:hypothetical protein
VRNRARTYKNSVGAEKDVQAVEAKELAVVVEVGRGESGFRDGGFRKHHTETNRPSAAWKLAQQRQRPLLQHDKVGNL